MAHLERRKRGSKKWRQSAKHLRNGTYKKQAVRTAENKAKRIARAQKKSGA